MPMCAYIGRPAWNRLPEDLRQPLLNAANATTIAHRAECMQKSQAAMDQLKQLGVNFTPMPEEERNRMRHEMAEKLWSAFAKDYPAAKPIIDDIQATRQA
jgi:TRAP-type C4-dicarboxylate transport system substrate-binding protein